MGTSLGDYAALEGITNKRTPLTYPVKFIPETNLPIGVCKFPEIIRTIKFVVNNHNTANRYF